MSSRGLVQKGSSFGGHSLGEYAALASVADVLPITSLIEVVFYRVRLLFPFSMLTELKLIPFHRASP